MHVPRVVLTSSFVRVASLLTSLTLLACGPTTSQLADGTFVASSSSALGSASLVVETAAKTATLTLPTGGTSVMMELTALPRPQWEQGCPANFSSVAVETFSVTPDPLVLGSVTLTRPRLTAGCGLDVANADEVRLAGVGAGEADASVVFSRLTR